MIEAEEKEKCCATEWFWQKEMVLQLAASLSAEEGLNLLFDGIWNRKNRGRLIHKEVHDIFVMKAFIS